MGLHTIILNLFASIAIGSASGIILTKNPINSLMFLILVFCNATGLLILYKIELIAMMFIIIYVGAIAVLFLFVVMMLNIKMKQDKQDNIEKLDEKKNNGNGWKIWAIGIGYNIWINTKINKQAEAKNKIIDLAEDNTVTQQDIISIANLWEQQENILTDREWTRLIETTTNIQSLGRVMYTYYSYYMILAGMILLIAMIGAIVLTMYKKKNAWKKQRIHEQVNRGQDSIKVE